MQQSNRQVDYVREAIEQYEQWQQYLGDDDLVANYGVEQLMANYGLDQSTAKELWFDLQWTVGNMSDERQAETCRLEQQYHLRYAHRSRA